MTAQTMISHNPATGEAIDTDIALSTLQDVGAACAAADAAFASFRKAGAGARAALLDAIAAEIEGIGDALIETCMAESGLPRGRIEGERGRTVGQLRLFAAALRDGRLDRDRVDAAGPAHPELVMRMMPLGPVAVFGASNFPLAFSVAGGDTASALAAGCPVVVKAHPAHPRTSRLVADAVHRAVAGCGLDAGCFAILFDTGHDVAEALVRDPRIKAVGFTGSRVGGLALQRIVQSRAEPIPLYAEMGSINPVVLLPDALARRGAEIAQAFAESVVLGAGQFCTSPGVVFGIDGSDLEAFIKTAAGHLAMSSAQTMLTDGICGAYRSGVARTADIEGVEHWVAGDVKGCAAQPNLFVTDANRFLANESLHEEVFGPVSLVVKCADEQELLSALQGLKGQLTGSIHAEPSDAELTRMVVDILDRKVGRLIFDGFGTGVAVTPAMVHGGPFPASSDGRSTSVGLLAIERFQRPICFQNMPSWLAIN